MAYMLRTGLLLAALAHAATGKAAEANQSASDAKARAQTQASMLMASPENNPQTGILPGSGVALRASNDSSQIALTLAPTANDLLNPNGQTSWSLTLNAPFDKKAGSGSFVTEQGLSNDFSAELGITRIKANLDRSDKKRDAAIAKYFRLCGDKCYRGHDLADASDEQLQPLSPEEIAAIRNDAVAYAAMPITIFNLTGSVGYHRFGFHSPTDFSPDHQNKISYSLSASFGVNPHRNAPFFGVGAELKRDYDASDKRVICPANPNPATPTACHYEIFDAPKPDISHTIFALVRFANWSFLQRADGRQALPFALEIKAAYDVHDRIFGVSVPAYLFLDDKHSFRGGAKFSWADRTRDSNKDEFKFSVFIVKSFDFFGLGAS